MVGADDVACADSAVRWAEAGGVHWSVSMVSPYPLTFEPMLFAKVWGGNRLALMGKPLALEARVGESWELADLSSTSPSGAGGEAARSVIASGPMKGKTIGDAVRLWGDDLLGGAKPAEDGGFPLLVKFLDARENLSVQVHPSAAYAASHPEAKLKTECWYVISADIESVIYKGVRPGVTPEQFRSHIASGAVEHDLVAVPAIPGELHELPSGTVHALGAGLFIAEIQTPSDTTFRVFDWGREGRALHVDEAMRCIDFGPAGEAASLADEATSGRLTANSYFTIDEHRLQDGARHRVAESRRCVVLMCVGGRARLESADGAGFETVPMPAGVTVLLPAAIAEHAVMCADPVATVLRVEIGGG